MSHRAPPPPCVHIGAFDAWGLEELSTWPLPFSPCSSHGLGLGQEMASGWHPSGDFLLVITGSQTRESGPGTLQAWVRTACSLGHLPGLTMSLFKVSARLSSLACSVMWVKCIRG